MVQALAVLTIPLLHHYGVLRGWHLGVAAFALATGATGTGRGGDGVGGVVFKVSVFASVGFRVENVVGFWQLLL